MKKKNFFIAVMLLLATLTKAQPSQQQPHLPPTAEERLKYISENLDKDLQLTILQKDKVLAAYKAFFANMEKNKNNDNKLPMPPPPPPVNKEIAEKLSAERDAKIKQALPDEQYKKYVILEKTMRPKRPEMLDKNAPPNF